VKSWLSRIAINAAMDTQRPPEAPARRAVSRVGRRHWQPPAPDTADPVTTALATERHNVLEAALAAITRDQRAAIVLYDVEGYDYAEIADMTNVSLGTVKSRIHRGRLALRELLADRMELFRG
jgi:RNA polymerase sigma-70 factor (ECF subfamily)